MSLFKEPFHANITGQLNKRQDIIGKDDRSPQELAYLHGKTAWVQLRSSVDVNDSYKLAGSNVLLGGVLLPTDKLRTDIIGTTGFGIYDNTTYNADTNISEPNIFGVRPMPGITDISIQSKSAYGSLRQATVNFQCWDVKQLDILETLYMRPGFTVLLEWGWTPFMDNNGKLVNTIYHDEDFFAHRNINIQQYLTNLRNRALGSHGNYDAMFGYIKNYSWKLRANGGYDCMTEIISTGEMLESFKINYSGATVASNSSGTLLSNSDYDKLDDIQKEYRRNLLAGLLAETYAMVKEKAGTSALASVTAGAALATNPVGAAVAGAVTLGAVTGIINPDRFRSINEGSNAITYTANNGKTGTIYYATKELELESDSIWSGDGTANGGAKSTDGYVNDDDSNVYITLRSFVELLNNFILLENPASTEGDKNIIKLSVDDRPDSINAGKPLHCLYNPLQISVDPRVCILKNDLFEKLIQGINIIDETPNELEVVRTIDPKVTTAQYEPIIKQLKDIRASDCFTCSNEQAFKNVLSKITSKEQLAGISDYYYTKYNETFYDFLTSGGFVSSDMSQSSVGTQFSGLGITNEDVYYFENDAARAAAALLTADSAAIGQFINMSPDLRKELAVKSGKNKTEEQIETLDEAKEAINSSEVGYLTLCNQLSQAYHTNDVNVQYGVHGNIFLNLRMLYNLAASPELEGQDPSEKQSISLMSYLKDMLTMVQNSIGNVNNFEVVIEGNVGYIVDVNNVPSTPVKPFTFEIGSKKSIVRDISFESQIFSDQSTIIAVAAQSDAGKLGLENSSMVAYNNGITDRNILKKDMPVNINHSESDQLTGFITALADLTELFDSMDKFLGVFDSELLVDSVEKYKKALTDIIVFFTSKFKSPNKYKAILPTKLSITTDGIGGLIIGNIFDIDKTLTPKSYKGEKDNLQLQYLVTNIKQDVGQNNQWTTTIEGNPYIPDESFNKLTNGQEPISVDLTIVKTRVYDESTGTTKEKSTVKVQDSLNINPNKVGADFPPMPPDWAKARYKNAHIPIEAMVGVQKGGGGARDRYKYKGTGNWVLLHPEAAAQYAKWQAQAKKDGVTFSIASGYRDLAHQGGVQTSVGSQAASPGSSAHGLGITIDISTLKDAAGNSDAPAPNARVRATNPLYKWLAKTGPDYGWYNPYRLADGSSQEESWHWEYWGFWVKPKK